MQPVNVQSTDVAAVCCLQHCHFKAAIFVPEAIAQPAAPSQALALLATKRHGLNMRPVCSSAGCSCLHHLEGAQPKLNRKDAAVGDPCCGCKLLEYFAMPSEAAST